MSAREFRRIGDLPPYVFAVIRELTLELRRAGDDVIDLGFGNPDLPSPAVAVAKLAEAAEKPHNHRYSASKGIPKLRLACADLYRRRFGVELDPETQVVATMGAKEGFVHLMWVLLEPGDAALVPAPSYPIHIHGPILAGASVFQVKMGPDEDLFSNLVEAWELARPRPRVMVLSFPHNPTTATVELDFMERAVAFAREHDVLIVHDFAYADLGFDGHYAALDPAGARRGRCRGRALYPDQVLLHGRVASGLRGGERSCGAGTRPAQVVAGLRDVPTHSDRRAHRAQRSARDPAGGGGGVSLAARRAL